MEKSRNKDITLNVRVIIMRNFSSFDIVIALNVRLPHAIIRGAPLSYIFY